jgi:GNAT superfamily N-acetyltransferase
MNTEAGSLRLATEADIPALNALIATSVRQLQRGHYSHAQREAAIGLVFGVDSQLIRDGTYYVVEQGGALVGCGGWSRRRTTCGADNARDRDDALLDPAIDSARIRAFFVDPAWSRRGIARMIMEASERALTEAGFRSVEIAATLPGVPFYTSFGCEVAEYYEIPLRGADPLAMARMTKRYD